MQKVTRKLCYRKDDRAMRPILGCPELCVNHYQCQCYLSSSSYSTLERLTRKLCYRKDDRAMRPIGLQGCTENFREFLTTPTATIPNIFHGLLFGSTLWMFLQNLKSVALPVPEIIGGTQKNWTISAYAHAPFSPKF